VQVIVEEWTKRDGYLRIDTVSGRYSVVEKAASEVVQHHGFGVLLRRWWSLRPRPFAVYGLGVDTVLQIGSRKWNFSEHHIEFVCIDLLRGFGRKALVRVDGRPVHAHSYVSPGVRAMARMDLLYGQLEEELDEMFFFLEQTANPPSLWPAFVNALQLQGDARTRRIQELHELDWQRFDAGRQEDARRREDARRQEK
jgi:hypothetical protein